MKKVIFNDVHGAVDIRNQSVYLKELSMKGMGSEMNTTLVYQENVRNKDLRVLISACITLT